jgi:hypothetical protein
MLCANDSALQICEICEICGSRRGSHPPITPIPNGPRVTSHEPQATIRPDVWSTAFRRRIPSCLPLSKNASQGKAVEDGDPVSDFPLTLNSTPDPILLRREMSMTSLELMMKTRLTRSITTVGSTTMDERLTQHQTDQWDRRWSAEIQSMEGLWQEQE